MSKLMYEERKECGHMKDIIDCIQDRVDAIVSKCYKNDSCYPDFKVLYYGKMTKIKKLF